jgi:hypothetical protein
LAPLNLVYGNNHFEPINFFKEITNIFIHIHNGDKRKEINTNKNININNKKIKSEKNSWNL